MGERCCCSTGFRANAACAWCTAMVNGRGSMRARRSPFFTFWPSLKATSVSGPSTCGCTVTVTSGTALPSPSRYTGTSRCVAAVITTGMGRASAPPLPAGAALLCPAFLARTTSPSPTSAITPMAPNIQRVALGCSTRVAVSSEFILSSSLSTMALQRERFPCQFVELADVRGKPPTNMVAMRSLHRTYIGEISAFLDTGCDKLPLRSHPRPEHMAQLAWAEHGLPPSEARYGASLRRRAGSVGRRRVKPPPLAFIRFSSGADQTCRSATPDKLAGLVLCGAGATRPRLDCQCAGERVELASLI